MTKYQFLNELDQLLHTLSEAERREILEDYEEHFAFAKRAEKSDKEVIALVGTPAEIAQEILSGQEYSKAVIMEEDANLQKKEAVLKEKSEALVAQAQALEAKLAQQAEELEAKASELSEQAEARSESIGTQVGQFVDSIAATVGSAIESVTGAITESFEMDEEGMPENGVRSETLIEEIIDMTEIKNVVIDGRNQKIDIKKTTYPTARIRLARGMLAVKTEGDTLFIESRALKRILTVGSVITIESQTPALEVELPIVIYDLVKATTTNGKIEIENISMDQLKLESNNGKLEVEKIIAHEAHLKTGNGKIQVKDVKGKITAETTNGKLSLSAIDGDVHAKTSNGKIELTQITKDVTAQTSNGKIEFEGQTIHQNVNLTTSNAKIEMILIEKPEDARFELSTSNSKTRLFDTDRNHDVFGAGSYEVKLATSNAKIEVYQKGDSQSR